MPYTSFDSYVSDMAVSVGVEAEGERDGPLEVAGVSPDFVSTLELSISAVTSVFSSVFPSDIMLAPSSLVAEDVLCFSALFESPLLPDLPRPLRFEILLKNDVKLGESPLKCDEPDCELERAGDPLFDGFDEAVGNELDDSSSDIDVDADERSLIIILS